MLKFKKKKSDVQPNYDKEFTGDHKADNMAMIGCMTLIIIAIAVIIYFVFL